MKYSFIRLAFVASVLSLFLGVPQDVSAQRRAVTGTITDARTGAPIAGAQISVRDRTAGGLSNAEGRYLIQNLPAGRLEIRALFMGYAPQSQTVEVAAGETKVVDFKLSIQAIEMEGLVATGYATQTRAEVSTSISQVSMAELEAPTIANLEGLLQGKAAGLNIVQSAGNPGNAMAVKIRGASSISASTMPLYVVDGMPIFREDFSQGWSGGQDISAITGLSAEEIESVSVLKDASAAAIYGSRGSNGVVLITTKRGAVSTTEGGPGAPRWEFSLSHGRQKMADKIDYMNTAEYLAYFADGMRMDGYSESQIQEEFDTWGVDPSVSTDWLDVISRVAPMTDASLSMSGGTTDIRYRFAGSLFDQTGILKGSSYKRAAGQANIDVQATDRIDLALSLTMSQEVNDRIQGDNAWVSPITDGMGMQPWVPVYNPDGSYNGDGAYPNALAAALEEEWDIRTLRGIGNIRATAVLSPWLRVTGRVGFDYLDMRERQYSSPLVPLSDAVTGNGISMVGNAQGRRHLVEAFLTANKFFGVHEVSLIAGSSMEGTDRERSVTQGEGFSSEKFKWPENAAISTDFGATTWKHSLKSGFARVNYSYDNRYTLNGSFRTDGSSRFGPENKWGTFLALSGAWDARKEGFMEGVDFLTDLKLRASFGQTGNEAIGDFQFLGLYGTDNYGDVSGWSPSRLANPGLTWEKASELDIGVDASAFSDRVGVVFDLYSKKTRDLLLSRPTPAATGFTSVLANVGAMENRGFEVLLRTVNVQGGGTGSFGWTTEFTVTHNKNEVTKLYSPDPSKPGTPFRSGRYNRIAEGHAISEFWGYKFEGVDPANGNALFTKLDANGKRVGTTTSPKSGEDRMFIGTPHPKYYGGLNNTMNFRGFDLRAFVQYSSGNQMATGLREWGDDGGLYQDNKFAWVGDDYWTPTNTDAKSPRPSYEGRSGAWIQSSRWVEDASYIRLQEVALGYALPRSLASKLTLSQARLYVTGTNLYTWTAYTGFSPDMSWSGATPGNDSGMAMLGVDFYGYPLARTFTIGFQANW